MGNYSKRKTIYAIGSEIEQNKDEPLFLVIDNEITDGKFILKYIPNSEQAEAF